MSAPTLRTLIVDDEPVARRILVFLDLQMPEMGGLDLVRRLSAETSFPAIVIVTAFDQHAIRAFEAGAVDYLLKPVSRERLLQAVERVRRNSPRQAVERVAQLQEIPTSRDELPARKIIARSGTEYILLAASEVYAFQAEGDLVWILTAHPRIGQRCGKQP